MKKHSLAVIPGDGIGPEVTAAAIEVLDRLVELQLFDYEATFFELGANRYLKDGSTLPEAELAQIKQHDAILFGAVGGKPGDPALAGADIERGLLLKLRFELDHYVNFRPAVAYQGVASPLADSPEIDFVVIREGTEGAYAGIGGSLRKGTTGEIATEVSVNTAPGVERVVRYAFELANSRPAKKLTWVHKTNVLTHAGKLWQRTVEQIATEFPEIIVDYLHIDAATIFMVQNPARFDVIVTDNLFGDIITDLAAAITGGIGLAASGNINPEGKFPSMFEPVHGSAPDIAGAGIADPTAAILSVAIMLDHLQVPAAAEKIRAAVVADLAEREPGSSTKEIAAAIISKIN